MRGDVERREREPKKKKKEMLEKEEILVRMRSVGYRTVCQKKGAVGRGRWVTPRPIYNCSKSEG